MEASEVNISQGAYASNRVLRGRIDILRRRATMLTGTDKILMTMYLENGNTFRQIAELAGINEATVARRIRRISKRLIKGRYIACVKNREKFTLVEMEVAKEYFLLGLSQRDIAEKRNCTHYQIRKLLQRIERVLQRVERLKAS